MAKLKRIKVKAGDTETLTLEVDAEGISNLDDVQSAALYMRKKGNTSNHVDGATVTVSDSANKKMEFDPAGSKSGGGDAFDAKGVYAGYILITWTDGDQTRHPDKWDLEVEVVDNLE